MRILFLSASVGVGHLSAANAVGAALREIDPDARTPVVDSYKYAALVVSRVVSDGYLRMVKTIPQMYRFIYDRAERAALPDAVDDVRPEAGYPQRPIVGTKAGDDVAGDDRRQEAADIAGEDAEADRLADVADAMHQVGHQRHVEGDRRVGVCTG